MGKVLEFKKRGTPEDEIIETLTELISTEDVGLFFMAVQYNDGTIALVSNNIDDTTGLIGLLEVAKIRVGIADM